MHPQSGTEKPIDNWEEGALGSESIWRLQTCKTVLESRDLQGTCRGLHPVRKIANEHSYAATIKDHGQPQEVLKASSGHLHTTGAYSPSLDQPLTTIPRVTNCFDGAIWWSKLFGGAGTWLAATQELQERSLSDLWRWSAQLRFPAQVKLSPDREALAVAGSFPQVHWLSIPPTSAQTVLKLEMKFPSMRTPSEKGTNDTQAVCNFLQHKAKPRFSLLIILKRGKAFCMKTCFNCICSTQ